MPSALQEAIDRLEIKDVYVREVSASTSEDFDPRQPEALDALSLEVKHVVTRSLVVEDGETRFLKVLVDFGVRWVRENEEPSAEAVDSEAESGARNDGAEAESEAGDIEAEVVAVIESGFVAEYAMSDEISAEGIEEFSFKNASLHIWPFWRELLASQCARMRLPHLVLPVAHIPSNYMSTVPTE